MQENLGTNAHWNVALSSSNAFLCNHLGAAFRVESAMRLVAYEGDTAFGEWTRLPDLELHKTPWCLKCTEVSHSFRSQT